MPFDETASGTKSQVIPFNSKGISRSYKPNISPCRANGVHPTTHHSPPQGDTRCQVHPTHHCPSQGATRCPILPFREPPGEQHHSHSPPQGITRYSILLLRGLPIVRYPSPISSSWDHRVSHSPPQVATRYQVPLTILLLWGPQGVRYRSPFSFSGGHKVSGTAHHSPLDHQVSHSPFQGATKYQIPLNILLLSGPPDVRGHIPCSSP